MRFLPLFFITLVSSSYANELITITTVTQLIMDRSATTHAASLPPASFFYFLGGLVLTALIGLGFILHQTRTPKQKPPKNLDKK